MADRMADRMAEAASQAARARVLLNAAARNLDDLTLTLTGLAEDVDKGWDLLTWLYDRANRGRID